MASGLAVQLSESDKNYLIEGCADDCRTDGREREEMRRYTIVTSTSGRSSVESASSSSSSLSSSLYPPLILSNGSARLFLSCSASASTHLLCSVKVELCTPSQARPNQGNLSIHVQDSLATSSSASRKKSEQDRSNLEYLLSDLLATNLLDLEGLCILPHHYAFHVHVDVEILAGTGGNLVDACGHVIRAALQNTLLPRVVPSAHSTTAITSSSSSIAATPSGSSTTDLHLDPDLSQATTPKGIENSVVVVTVTICRRIISNNYLLLLDASLEEEACSWCQVHVAVDCGKDKLAEPTICALRKTGNGSLPWALLPDITALAIQAVTKAKACYRIGKSHYESSQQPHVLQTQLDIQ